MQFVRLLDLTIQKVVSVRNYVATGSCNFCSIVGYVENCLADMMDRLNKSFVQFVTIVL